MTVESPSCDRLALILGKLDEASGGPKQIDGLLTALADFEGPFDGAAAFSAAGEGLPFVMIASRGDPLAVRARRAGLAQCGKNAGNDR